MAKILVIGAGGLVGSRILELSKFKDEMITPTHKELDITDLAAVKAYMEKMKPDVVVNLAAFTDVTEGEKQRGDETGLCWRLNVAS